MKKTLLFATGNPNKVKEIKALVSDLSYEVITMADIGFHEDIPETGSTLEENANLKAQYLFERTNKEVIAEDTGLEVDALQGEPGVYSARYAGAEKDPEKNMSLLLSRLGSTKNRSARFKTVISLIGPSGRQNFEGVCEGNISLARKGEQGFGYDPIFVPVGYQSSFAEMSMTEKSKISHRGRALEKLIAFLQARSV